MKNKGTKQKSKKKGNDNAFGCDLIEHLQASGRDVPQVLQKCAEFIEKHGIVDGIYRLSGVTSNIQRLRQEFSSEACPDLTKEVYLQDIHCVGSLCKLYFRELPNPLLTYELYGKFTETVSVCGDHERLLHIQRVIKELPSPHFRTLEFLTKHLARLATLSAKTNMHTRNLALVWAPNLLRSKTIESSAGNGDMAFQEVRIQQSVVEFILNHTEQIFNDSAIVKPKDGPHVKCGEKYATLPISGQCGPMKLMSLEEAQARSLSPNHPVHKERQRENSLPDTSKAALYHTVIDLSDKRKLNGKSRKWKSIFNLGRSVDSKGKLSRNGSVFIRTGSAEKTALRPSRSMESLCSLTTDEGQSGNNSTASSSNSIQNMKSRTLDSDSLHDLSENDQKWDFKGKKSGGATGGWGSINQKSPAGASGSPQKTLPEQLKVFKGDDLRGNQPTSPKNRRMLYSGASQSGSSRPSFPGSFFPLESSPRHQRRAVNISEPFAVSVPLRVSAVISTNSTPCRNLAKDKAATLKPFKETSEPSSSCGKSNTFPQLDSKRQEGTEKKETEELVDRVPGEDTSSKSVQGDEKWIYKTELDKLANVTEERTTGPSAEEQLNNQYSLLNQSETSSSGDDLWPDLSQELKIIEPEIDLLDKTSKPVFSSCNNMKLTMDVKSKRSRSSPSLTLLCREKSSPIMDHVVVESSKKQPSEPDVMFHKSLEELVAGSKDDKEKRSLPISPLRKFNSIECKMLPLPLRANGAGEGTNLPTPGGAADPSEFPEAQNTDVGKNNTLPEFELIQRLSVCLEERPNTLHIPDDDDEGHHEELDLVESWEDLSCNKQWVTSPLHSPDVEELLNKLSPFLTPGKGSHCDQGNMSFTTQPFSKSSDPHPGAVPPPPSSKPDAKRTYLPAVPMRVSSNSAQASLAKCSAKQKSSQRFYRQMSYEAAPEKKDEHHYSKSRPYSLNLDLGQRCIRDISNQQTRTSSEVLAAQKASLPSTGAIYNGLTSDLEFFLNDGLAPQRRNSAPVSVSSVRTAFMIKTCQAKAVPVVPPKVQYSQIPHSRQEKDVAPVKQQEKEPKISSDKNNVAPTAVMSDLKEEIENKEPVPKHQTAAESVRTVPTPEVPVITRRHAPSLEVFVDGSRPNKANLLQRPSFRNRQRPQSLILLSPPFPIMDYHPSGDDSKILSSMKSLNEAPPVNALSKDVSENLRTSEGLQNKMTIPKSGQRLETSTSCFYQPQRRSMIFDSRSHRQIE